MTGIRRSVFVTLALVALLGGAWMSDEKSAGRAVVKGNNAFALDLYAKLSARDGNLFFSPYSISTALAMTYAGARGDTAKQMAKALHLGPNGKPLHDAFGELVSYLNAAGKKKGYQLSVANALWAQKGYRFLDDYLTLVTGTYEAGLSNLDFAKATEAARKTINKWVEKKTQDKIKDLFKPGTLNAASRMVLTNAIYFKGDWASQFDKENTNDLPFHLAAPEGKPAQVDVPMMLQTAKFKYAETDKLQALELPYGRGDLSMIVLLPRQVDGLGHLEKALSSENLSGWLSKLRKRKVTVFLPKFKMTSEFNLNKTLSSMGMTDAFTDKADFSGMDGTRYLFIQAVVHKAFVDVNEEGTEAAAATGIGVGVMMAPEPPAVFRADHPFVFLIRDKSTDSILFLGRVMNPKD